MCAPYGLIGFSLEQCRRGIIVNEYNICVEYTHSFCIGECVYFKDKSLDHSFIRRAQKENKQGKLVDCNICDDIKEKPKHVFKEDAIPTIIELADKPIINFKNFTLQTGLITLLMNLLIFRHKLLYTT